MTIITTPVPVPSHEIAHALRTSIAKPEPLEAPPMGTSSKLNRFPLKDLGLITVGTLGNLKCLGRVVDPEDERCVYLNVAATRTETEACRAAMQLGEDMTFYATESRGRWDSEIIRGPRDSNRKPMTSCYKMFEAQIPMMRLRNAAFFLKTALSETDGVYMIDTGIEGALQWRLMGIVSNLTGLPMRPEWGLRLWQAVLFTSGVKKCPGGPLTIYKVKQDADWWRGFIQGGRASGLFALEDNNASH